MVGAVYVFPEHSTLCRFDLYEGMGSVNESAAPTIMVDIEIDEAQNISVYSSKSENRGNNIPDRFRDYQPEPGFIGRLKRKFNVIFNKGE